MTFDATAHGSGIERDGYTVIEDFTPARLDEVRRVLALYLGTHPGAMILLLAPHRAPSILLTGGARVPCSGRHRARRAYILALCERFLPPNFCSPRRRRS